MNRGKRSSTTLLGILALACGVLSGPGSAADVAAERAEIARVIDSSIGWFKTKDFDLLFRVLLDAPEFFIFHPDSRTTVRGGEAFRKLAEVFRDPELTYAGHEIRDLNINLSRSGEVAWFSAILDDCAQRNGKKSCWKDCRWTGVVERRDGRWVIAQMHFSLASDKVAEAARQSAPK
ncbi:MAG: nuclear transport factor 2 family protein [Acidobacteria bacterium]|nr:nuclear transport factor 2 family protein [Acidobacteriota bacterium]